MAKMVDPPKGKGSHGKHYYTMCQTMFEIDTKYVPIEPIGRGAYGVVCSSMNTDTNEKVAIKKINNVFENEKMLAFDPSKRISVTEALEHPYMSTLYDPSANHPAQAPIDLDIDEKLGVDMIREMLWQEMLQYPCGCHDGDYVTSRKE